MSSCPVRPLCTSQVRQVVAEVEVAPGAVAEAEAVAAEAEVVVAVGANPVRIFNEKLISDLGGTGNF